jgi:4-hydroxy-tetrahydrodipicolinate reductase
MGNEVELIALARGHRITFKLDNEKDWEAFTIRHPECDVVIDFSLPGTAVSNIRNCFNLALPVVMGTTGWYAELDKVKKWCTDESAAIMVASNFSLGVNLLFELTRKLAIYLDGIEDYDISIEEIHHQHKIDSPSGTAIKLAEIVLDQLGRKKKWINQASAEPDVLPVISHREGEVTGTHIITCESQADILELKHTAKNRKGFALGAVMAAEWIIGKKGYFEMKDLLDFRD